MLRGFKFFNLTTSTLARAFLIKCPRSPPGRSLHISSQKLEKVFIDSENAFAYNVLPQLPPFQPLEVADKPVQTLQEFQELLGRHYRTSNASAIVETFQNVKNFCIKENIPISDQRFDNLVDGLMDHCEKLTDAQLFHLLQIISELPPCNNTTSHNFHDVWSCLDDICCWKMGSWDIETLLKFCNAWYKLNLGRLSDFVYEAIDKIAHRSRKISKSLLLYTFFHLNINRKFPVTFDFEHTLLEHINSLSIDEMGIIAMGYFKTRTKIRHKAILSSIIRKTMENASTIHEITLTTILKVIRLSQHLETVDEICEMLDKLLGEIPRLSSLTCVHLALIGTSLQIKHEGILTKSTQKIVENIQTIRLKDIERILLVNSMFNGDPEGRLFQAALTEINKNDRIRESIQYNKCMPSILHYLSFRRLYNYELMDQVLDEDYINEIYGKPAKFLPRELFSLDCSIDIECPDYAGNRLSPTKRYKAAKWLVEYPPKVEYKKKTLTDKFTINVEEQVVRLVKDPQFVQYHHILPHFSRPDIIVCRNRNNGEFIEPFGFENYILGDIQRPVVSIDKYEWIAILCLPRNLQIRGTHQPLGGVVMKERQLKHIGYRPILVFWDEFLGAQEKNFQIMADKLA